MQAAASRIELLITAACATNEVIFAVPVLVGDMV